MSHSSTAALIAAIAVPLGGGILSSLTMRKNDMYESLPFIRRESLIHFQGNLVQILAQASLDSS